MAKQLYDYWFVQFDFPNEDGKPYKSSGGAMVWNEKLKRRIPEGWNVMSINEICTSCRGVSYGKDDLLSDSNGVLVLRGNNIENNRIVYDSNVAFVPNDFVLMLLIPASSTTLRAGPPAITPVPSGGRYYNDYVKWK